MPPLHHAVPERPSEASAIALKATQPGALRDKAVEILGLLMEAPERANPQLRRLFRRERSLGSRDRGLAKDCIVYVLRHGPLLQSCLLRAGWGGDREPMALWLAALVGGQGVPPAVAGEAFGAPLFAELEHPRAALARWAEGGGPAGAIAAAGSVPTHVAEALVRRFGMEAASAFVVACNQRAPIALRANLAKTSPERLIQDLAAEDIRVDPMRWARAGLIAQGPANLIATRSFKRGDFELQDEGSQLIAELVSPPRRGLVFDLCAGAGGKSLAIAAELPKGAHVLATDVRAGALRQAARRAERAGVSGRVRFQQITEGGPLPVAADAAARVLVDAPCSGSGTLRRSPAIRWRLEQRRLAELTALQAQLLARAADLVRPGGRLIYATCSVLPQENEGQVEGFLVNRPNWRLIPIKEVLGAERAEALSEAGMLVTTPQDHDTDGFFAAILQRDR